MPMRWGVVISWGSSKRFRVPVLILAAAAGIAAVLLALASTAEAKRNSRAEPAPLLQARSAPIAHQYIVVLRGRLPAHPTKRTERAATAKQARVASSVGAEPGFEYGAAINGFSAGLTQAQVRRLRRSPRVKYVEEDARIRLSHTQHNAPWNLDRIDQRSVLPTSTYDYSRTGEGVHAYVIDSGIQAHHPDFGDRAHNGFDALGDDGSDCHGHGTHVAGTIGGHTYGVAKRVTLVGIRVLGCNGSGTTAGVIAGVDHVTAHHAALSVANMSLGGGASTSVDSAVTHLVNSGVFTSVAAGNDKKDACGVSPARVPVAFTVGATSNSDHAAPFSNYGPCLDIYAPGANITSDWTDSTTKTISGTSMAAPAVAGVAALHLSHYPASTPAAIASWLRDHATRNVVKLKTFTPTSTAGTPNLLLFKGGL